LLPGSAWAKTSPSPAIKFKNVWVPTKSKLAAKMGIDPDQASNLLAEFLPKVVDKITPQGKVDPTADHQQGLAALIPSLLQTLSGSGATRT
jgi:hypothetical protein